jgi:hypothetical protein
MSSERMISELRTDSSPTVTRVRVRYLVLVVLLATLPSACSKREAPRADTAVALGPAPIEANAPSSSSSSPSGSASVRGTLTNVTDTSLIVSSATGDVSIRVAPPLHVYARVPSDLAHVTPNAFVGVTSVAQPDGSERATEIHVFPEELRGTGEGSRLMTEAQGTPGRNTMTNGTVSGSRMTNGSVSGSRMTNGTVGASAGGSSLTVQYAGGTKSIRVPAGVIVTAIAPTRTKLAPGARVIVLTTKAPDGRLSASSVMLAGASFR